jgi:HMG (high mobility group) box
LARSYITHTNKLLGSAALPPALDPDSFPSAFSTLFATGGAGLLPGIAAGGGASSSVGGHGAGAGGMGGLGAVDSKARAPRKPRRRVKDPNAPKRPLTAYFLFAMDERAKVKEMLPHANSSDVNKEILNRWTNMPDENKAVSSAPSCPTDS